MHAQTLLSTLHRQGFILTPLADGKLEVRPKSKLTPELREELKQHKAEVLTLLKSYQPSLLLCPHCGQPVTIDDVCPSLDGERTLTLWRCDPCQTVAVTPDTIEEPPSGWVKKTIQ